MASSPAQPAATAGAGPVSGLENLRFIAVLAGTASVAGLLLALVALTGTRRPPRPPGRVAARLQRMRHGGGRDASARRWLLIVAATAGALAFLLTGLPVVGLLVALAVPGAPWLFTVGRAEQRAISRIEAVGEWTRRLKDVSGTGQGLQQAIVGTIHTVPDEIAEEVRTLAARLQAGWPARNALLAFADEIADPVCDQVVAALILHLSDRGERLGDVLASIASAAAAEVGTRREVEAKRTQPRFAVRFLTGMTLLVLGYGLLNPEYMRPYGTPAGQAVMVVLGGGFVALLAWVRSMSLPPPAPRFLRPVGAGEVHW
ncbi:type II secretion system F family protein [Melissospora conviva]|uniref:type II secretion system F family protein n=1 Tax=Melissospora conviva TaxID=3388432 RepID=UPI003C132822